MRRVHLENLTPDMRLGKSIYHYNNLLLNAGTKKLNRYVPSLKNLGISFVYIDDELSEDIEIEDAISEKTRVKCKQVLQKSFQTLYSQGSLDLDSLHAATSSLLDEILSTPDVLISLSDIGTTDDSTLVHSVNTAVYSLLIAEQLDLPRSSLKELAEGTLLHDIGKTLINPLILYKAGSLTNEEFTQVKLHPQLGHELLKKSNGFSDVACKISLQHHERLDGSGYPTGLRDNAIPIFSQIAAIADMYDALTAERCYRPAMSNYEAYKILIQDSGTKLNADYLSLFLRHIAIYPNGSMVKLSDGTRGIVKAQNPEMPFHPIVRVINDSPEAPVKLYDLDLLKTLNVTIVN